MLHAYKDRINVFESTQAKVDILAVDTDRELVKLVIEPKGSIVPHVLSVKVTFYIISGAGMAFVNESKIAVSSGDVLEVEPDLIRGRENASQSMLEILVIKQL